MVDEAGAYTDGRQVAPAAARNRQPILDVLKRVLPPTGTVLELASGTGEHAVFLGPKLAPRMWQPTDIAPDALVSINAWLAKTGSANVRPPFLLDAAATAWPMEKLLPTPPITAVVAINMIHIAPWQACLGLIAGARRVLKPGGVLYLYGPYSVGGAHTAPSNATFDEVLKSQDPDWGVRDVDDVEAAASQQGFRLNETVAMPANNLSLVFVRG
ncbi:MAG: class I SAM-dependent methyltransferase [Sphingomonadales bacterium]|nr:class I SAM-dependent methyltransferase [Sphingomonadales bacterium]